MILFLKAIFLIWCLVTLLWIWSVCITNASIVDIFWGVGFVVVNTFYVFHLDKIEPRNIVLSILVAIWGLRLAIYLAFRNIGKGEDFRYQEFRKNYGEKRYWWLSYFQVFLLQGVLILIVSLPLFGVHYGGFSGELFWLDYIAILIWTIGFIFEAGGNLTSATLGSSRSYLKFAEAMGAYNASFQTDQGNMNIIINTNKSNPNYSITFRDAFPVSLGSIELDAAATSLEPIILDVSFAYTGSFSIEKIT